MPNKDGRWGHNLLKSLHRVAWVITGSAASQMCWWLVDLASSASCNIQSFWQSPWDQDPKFWLVFGKAGELVRSLNSVMLPSFFFLVGCSLEKCPELQDRSFLINLIKAYVWMVEVPFLTLYNIRSKLSRLIGNETNIHIFAWQTFITFQGSTCLFKITDF